MKTEVGSVKKRKVTAAALPPLGTRCPPQSSGRPSRPVRLPRTRTGLGTPRRQTRPRMDGQGGVGRNTRQPLPLDRTELKNRAATATGSSHMKGFLKIYRSPLVRSKWHITGRPTLRPVSLAEAPGYVLGVTAAGLSLRGRHRRAPSR